MDSNRWCLLGFRDLCLPDAVWAAWAQAILSAAAILAAWWLATRSERRMLFRKVEVYVNLVSMADNQCASLDAIKYAEPPAGSLGFHVTGHQVREFERLARAFQSIALQDVPDYRLLPVLRDAQHACEELEELLRAYRQTPIVIGDSSGPNPDILKLLRAKRMLQRAYKRASKIAAEYAIISPTRQAKHLYIKLRRWREK